MDNTGYFKLKTEEENHLWNKAVIVLDTSTLGNLYGIRGTGTFIHSLYTNKHNIFPQELLSKCSLS